MSIYLEFFNEAFLQIDQSYYSSYAFHFMVPEYHINPETMETYEQFAERNFAYELYYRFRTIMEEPENREMFEGLQLNGEVNKIGFNDTMIGQNAIVPDLVLHMSQSNIRPNNQKVFIEVKINPQADLDKDIKKLLFAVNEPLNFIEGLLICVNIPVDNTYYQIRNHGRVKNADEETLRKVFLLHSDLKILESFYEIVNYE